MAGKGPSLFVANTRGECGDDQTLSGYYFREARFLRTLRLEIDGDRSWLCEAAAIEPHLLSFHYVYPEVAEYGGGGSGQSGDDTPTNKRGIAQRALAIRLLYVVALRGLTARLTATNHSKRRVVCELAWQVGTDFADIQEAQNGRREQEAPVEAETRTTGLVFQYRHPELRYRSAVIALGDSPWTITASRISTPIDLESQQSLELGLCVDGSAIDGTAIADDPGERDRCLKDWRDGFARMSAPANRTAERIVTTSLRDFGSFPMLEGRSDEWLALQAGVPLYPALFGRDTLTAGWQAAWVDHGQSLGTLHLIHQQPPESLTAGTWDRFRALLDTVVH